MLKPRFQVIIRKDLKDKLLQPTDWVDAYTAAKSQEFVDNNELLLQAEQINISSRVENLTETAEIYISKRFVKKSSDDKIIFSFRFNKEWLNNLGYGKNVALNEGTYKVKDGIVTSTDKVDVEVELGFGIEINLTNNLENDRFNKLPSTNVSEFDKQHVFKKRFMGHVYAFAENTDFLILKCEDNMGRLKALKRKTFNFKKKAEILNVNEDLEGLIKVINDEWSKELGSRTIQFNNSIPDKPSNINVTLKGLMIQNVNPAEILDFIKKKYGVFVYFFKENYFYAGFISFAEYFNEIGKDSFAKIWRFTDPFLPGYDDQKNGSDPDIGNGCNPVISSDLDFKTVQNNSLMIIYSSADPIITPELDKKLSNIIVDGVAYTPIITENTILVGAKILVKYSYINGVETYNYELSNDVDDKNKYYKTAGAYKKYLSTETSKVGEINEENFAYKTSFNVSNQRLEDIKDIVKAAYQKTPKSGYSGSFTTFGIPSVTKGDLLLLNLSAKYDNFDTDTDTSDYVFNIKIDKNRSVLGKGVTEKDEDPTEQTIEIKVPFWLYYAKGVDITYSSENGYRQKIYIEKCVPFINNDRINYGGYPDTVKTFIKKISF